MSDTRLYRNLAWLAGTLVLASLLFAPRTLLAALPFLIFLACPLLMWWMMRSHGGHGAHASPREREEVGTEGSRAHHQHESLGHGRERG